MAAMPRLARHIWFLEFNIMSAQDHSDPCTEFVSNLYTRQQTYTF